MRRFTRLLVATMVALSAGATATAAQAQTATAGPEICVSIDDAHDTLTSREQAAAILLVSRQFELAGRRVVGEGCSTFYLLSHVMLGNTITVTLAGPDGPLEGTALGLDDLPALYSQMVRSIVTGRPMSGFNVVDRTNVTAAQSSRRRVESGSFGYARLGYGAVFGGRAYAGPAMGFGFRAELDTFAIDVSFLNVQFKDPSNRPALVNGTYLPTPSNGGFTGSWLRLEGLRFLNPTANASTYLGAGLGYGSTDVADHWHGNGLQGTLTVGRELLRASTLRAFVQLDAVLPFYRVTEDRFWLSPNGGPRYAPSFALSIGLGRARR